MKFEVLPLNARIEAVLVTDEHAGLTTSQVAEMTVDTQGFPGDRHYGYTKKAGARETNLYSKGQTITNLRQWSALSTEELEKIAGSMGYKEVLPEWVGANLLLSGIPEFSKLPSFTRLRIGTGSNPVTLAVYEANAPCKFPQPHIEKGAGSRAQMSFVEAAKGIRGLVGWVEHGGMIRQGDPVEVWLPANEYQYPR